MDEAGELLGYVKPGPTRDDDADGPGWGEIYALYVHPDRWSRGAGHALMSAAIERLDPAIPVALWRCGAVAPWVLTENAAALACYERQGFRPDGGAHLFKIARASRPELR